MDTFTRALKDISNSSQFGTVYTVIGANGEESLDATEMTFKAFTGESIPAFRQRVKVHTQPGDAVKWSVGADKLSVATIIRTAAIAPEVLQRDDESMQDYIQRIKQMKQG